MSEETRRDGGSAAPDGVASGKTQYICHEEAGEEKRESVVLGASAAGGATQARAPLGPARIAVAIVASLAIAFCAWSVVMYARGADPIALVSGSTFRTVAEESAASTSVAPAAGGGKSADAAASGTTADAAGAGSDGGAAGRGDAQGSQGAPDSSSGSAQSSAQTSAGAEPTVVSESSSTDARPAGEGVSFSSAEAAPAPSSEISVSVSIDGSLAGASGGTATVVLERGATVYDALLASGVDVNARPTGYGMYVAGINGVAETPTTGWTYTVGGSMPGVACSAYVLDDGDSVVWTYVQVDR